MSACAECHKSKVKCDKNIPCSRCMRLNKKCVPHVSKQGKRGKRNRPNEGETLSGAICMKGAVENGVTLSGDTAADKILRITLEASPRKDHYGLNWNLRMWLATAVRRRSLSLLSKTAALATRCGISMDQLLCGQDLPPSLVEGTKGGSRQMDFLVPILLTPAAQQQVVGNRLEWSEIPQSLLSATGLCCCLHESSRIGVEQTMPFNGRQDNSFSQVGNRWILIREITKGNSRFFTSMGFEKNILSWNKIQEKYIENKQDLIELLFNKSDQHRFMDTISSQLLLHSVPGIPPKPSLLSQVKVKLAHVEGIEAPCPEFLEVSIMKCLCILNIDHAFLYLEFFRSEAAPPDPTWPLPDFDPSMNSFLLEDDELDRELLEILKDFD